MTVISVAIALVVTLCFTRAVAAQNHSPPVFESPLLLHQTATLYVVNETGANFTLQMRWRDQYEVSADRPRMIRVFDPQENLLIRHFEPCERVKDSPPLHVLELPVQANGTGVYQVVVTGFGGELNFNTLPVMSWGVLGAPRLAGVGDQFADAFIYLPPQLDRLSLRVEGDFTQLQLTDAATNVKLKLDDANRAGMVALPADGEQVWRLSAQAVRGGHYRIDWFGLPIIVCPDEKSARAIRASVDVLDDGTICFHKFQIRAHELLRKYRGISPTEYHVEFPVLARHREQWLAEPARNELLMGPYGVYAALPATLREQNLDAQSPWFGSIFAWRDATGATRKENPWMSYSRLGLSRVAEFAAGLAAVYSIDRPFNPLHRNAALRNRIIIASLAELMLIQEHESPSAIGQDNYFGGERSVIFSGFLRAFPLIIDDCPDDVREVWTEGLRRYVDREAISQVAITANQWIFIIKALQHFADGTGEAAYRELVRMHLRWLLTRNQWDRGWQEAGYFDESGPDATYVGISTHLLAWVYQQMVAAAERGDADDADREIADHLGEALRRCFDLFNHTLAPQPDGSIVGAINFNTRTAENWTQPQCGGGIAMMAGDLDEAGPLAGRVWPTMRSLANDATARQATRQAMLERLQYLSFAAFTRADEGAARIGGGPDLHFAIWEHFSNQPRTLPLPIVTQRDFTKNFGDEFFCVRRPRYYAFLHAGTPVPIWQKEHRPHDANRQHPRNGGGLSMFWSPAFGVSLLAQNWSAYAAQTIIAESKDENGSHRADWEDYWSIKSEFDQQNARAAIAGVLRDQPIEFRRVQTFLREGVQCDVYLCADRSVNFDAMWECFPFPLKPAANLQVSLADEQGRPVRNRPASAIVIRNASHEAHVIVFAEPRMCSIGEGRSVDVYGQPREFGRVLAELPRQWGAAEEQTIRWRILAVPATDVASAIQRAVREMKQ